MKKTLTGIIPKKEAELLAVFEELKRLKGE